MKDRLRMPPKLFAAIECGERQFDIRKNSNIEYQKGDEITFLEFDESQYCQSSEEYGVYSGKKINAVITCVTNINQKTNFVVFGFKIITDTATTLR